MSEQDTIASLGVYSFGQGVIPNSGDTRVGGVSVYFVYPSPRCILISRGELWVQTIRSQGNTFIILSLHTRVKGIPVFYILFLSHMCPYQSG